MGLGFRKFISEVFVNGKFLKILPSKNFPLYGKLQYSKHAKNWQFFVFTWLIFAGPVTYFRLHV